MSLWDKIFNRGDSGAAGGGAKRLYIIDAASLGASNGGRARMAPRDQLDMLHRISRFVKKEAVQIIAVFDGKALRKVPDNSEYKDIMVRFSGKPSDLSALVVKLQKDHARRRDVVVITSDRDLEDQVIASGGETMRSSTFRKALEACGGSGDSSGASRRNRRPRRGGRRSGGPDARKKKPSKSKKSDSIHDLIDVVEVPPKQPKPADGGETPDGNVQPPPEPEPVDVDGNR